VVAGVALLLLLALVAVPGSVGSRAPSPLPTVNPEQLQTVLIDDGLAGAATIQPDPDGRSAGGLSPNSVLTEPGRSPALPVRPRASTPAAPAGKIARNPWHYDPEASFYGPGFYGRRTACGLAMTTSLRGVASRTLPCGTLVTFKNPSNGRTATVPVVDRGPYVSGRIWDLTGGLCEYLRHCYTGPILWHLGPASSA
jgi:hypothetical protein